MNWFGTIDMTACSTGNSNQRWTLERYDQGGGDFSMAPLQP